MIVSLFTPTAQFSNDLADVVRVFLGNIELKVNEPGGELTITHTETVEKERRICRMAASGLYAGAVENEAQVSADSLLEKRYHKRQIKQALYAVMTSALAIRGQAMPPC